MSDSIVSINNLKENILEFDLSVEGINANNVDAKFVIHSDGIDFAFPCLKESNGKWSVKLPPLPMLERTMYTYYFSVIAEGYHFQPLKGSVNVVGSNDVFVTTPKNPKIQSTINKVEEIKEKSPTIEAIKQADIPKTKKREKGIAQIAAELMEAKGIKPVVPIPKSTTVPKPIVPKPIVTEPIIPKPIVTEETKPLEISIPEVKSPSLNEKDLEIQQIIADVKLSETKPSEIKPLDIKPMDLSSFDTTLGNVKRKLKEKARVVPPKIIVETKPIKIKTPIPANVLEPIIPKIILETEPVDQQHQAVLKILEDMGIEKKQKRRFSLKN